MLFDLHGRRRRVVQATYLTLAVLMGGGLVFFGIGGDVSGGLFDAFSDRQGGGGSNTLAEDRIKSADRRLRTNPRDETALRELTRGHFQLASQDSNSETGQYGEEGKRELAAAARAWERYMALEPRRPDPSLARVMLQAYGEFGLNRPEQATQVAEIVTEAEPNAANYLTLARYARLAKQERKSELAGQRALDVADRSERKIVREQLKALEAESAQGAAAAGSGAP